MSRVNLRERISEGVFLLDGAMGTQLMAHGVEVGLCSDYLNIKSPDLIVGIHQKYLASGSDAVITNTFGANKYALGRHGYADKVKQINKAGAQIARKAAGEEKYVLGNIGPTGDFLQPLGSLKPEDLKAAFTEQAEGLVAGGVDGFIIETMTDIDEATIAIEAVKSSSKLPVFASMAFDKAGEEFRTMMGVDAKRWISQIAPLGVDAVGFNCGRMSLDDYVALADKYISTLNSLRQNIAIFAEPNAGLPELIDGQTVYKVSGEEFAAAAEKIHLAGINIIGGCCGTTPAHIEAVAGKLKK